MNVFLLTAYDTSPVETALAKVLCGKWSGPVESVVDSVDLIVAFGYRHRVPPKVLAQVRCVNIHPSLLPFGRGADPHLWAAIEGRPQGVTIHLMDEGIDTGNIIAQREMRRIDFLTMRGTRECLHILTEDMVHDNFKDIVQAPGQPQTGEGSYHYAKELDGQREAMADMTVEEMKR